MLRNYVMHLNSLLLLCVLELLLLCVFREPFCQVDFKLDPVCCVSYICHWTSFQLTCHEIRFPMSHTCYYIALKHTCIYLHHGSLSMYMIFERFFTWPYWFNLLKSFKYFKISINANYITDTTDVSGVASFIITDEQLQ